MKLKKPGAVLLALCMMFITIPTTAMADTSSIPVTDSQTKVIDSNWKFEIETVKLDGSYSDTGVLSITATNTGSSKSTLEGVKRKHRR